MKALGLIELKKPVTNKEFKSLIGNNKRVTIDFTTDLDNLLEYANNASFPIEGLNTMLDDAFEDYCPSIIGSLSDLSYKIVGLKDGLLTIRANCSVCELELD